MNERKKHGKSAEPREKEFLSSKELRKMCETDKVLVDSSTICAIVQERAFISTKAGASIFSKMEVRMFPAEHGQKRRKDMIFFGDYVKLSMVDLAHLFENISEIPEGTVKRAK